MSKWVVWDVHERERHMKRGQKWQWNGSRTVTPKVLHTRRKFNKSASRGHKRRRRSIWNTSSLKCAGGGLSVRQRETDRVRERERERERERKEVLVREGREERRRVCVWEREREEGPEITFFDVRGICALLQKQLASVPRVVSIEIELSCRDRAISIASVGVKASDGERKWSQSDPDKFQFVGGFEAFWTIADDADSEKIFNKNCP